MSLNCGIVGLPNVGKSTLFNILTKTQLAQEGNFPFCTIEPNQASVPIIDKRLQKLAEINKSKDIIYTSLICTDIAGLIAGAHEGEGLGNKFLANIRDTDAIIHLLRCFEDEKILHVSPTIDPIKDAETVNTELMLADIELLDKKILKLAKKFKSDKTLALELELSQLMLKHLSDGNVARTLKVEDRQYEKIIANMQLLTYKKVLYVSNVNDSKESSAHSQKVRELAKSEGAHHIDCSVKEEQEISLISDPAEREEYISMLGLEQSGIDTIVSKMHHLLDLSTYFTAGEKEARAWPFPNGTNAKDAAGIIHTDFSRGFIAAETTSYHDYINNNGLQNSKKNGKTRLEGRDYIVQDGDIINFRFNV